MYVCSDIYTINVIQGKKPTQGQNGKKDVESSQKGLQTQKALPHGFHHLTPPSGDIDLSPEYSRLRNEVLNTLNIIYKVTDTVEKTLPMA